MKIDIENILYIIVIIVWIVVGLIRKNKKKEGRPTTAMPPLGETQSPDISEMLEEILGKKSTVSPEQQPVPAEQKKIIPAIEKEPETLESISGTDYTRRSIKKTEKILHPRKRKPVVAIPKKAGEEIPEESDTFIRTIMEESQFDLRKAVIYSEILNPPFR